MLILSTTVELITYLQTVTEISGICKKIYIFFVGLVDDYEFRSSGWQILYHFILVILTGFKNIK